uniref:Structural molecule n=1 Tax=Solanum tuberosum TaxID=4113 RepID=M1D581_SOLTU
MEIGNFGVGFRPQIAINSTRKWRCKQFLGQKMQNKKSFLLVCSVASKVCSFSEEENGLIEALIGIQGRGRAASPQQLQEVERAVKVLEGSEGVSEPVSIVFECFRFHCISLSLIS